MNYASNGVGTIPHLAIEVLMREARIEMVHVPYKDLGAAITELVAGQEMLGMAGGPVRPGLPQITAEERRAMRADVEKTGLLARIPTAKAA